MFSPPLTLQRSQELAIVWLRLFWLRVKASLEGGGGHGSRCLLPYARDLFARILSTFTSPFIDAFWRLKLVDYLQSRPKQLAPFGMVIENRFPNLSTLQETVFFSKYMKPHMWYFNIHLPVHLFLIHLLFFIHMDRSIVHTMLCNVEFLLWSWGSSFSM